MNEKKNILVVFGTRPEVIKLAPVIIELRKHSEYNVILTYGGTIQFIPG